MGRVALTLFHLRIPHSVNPSSFTPWLQDSLWYLFLPLSRPLTHSPVSLALPLSLQTLLVSYLRESVVFTNGSVSNPPLAGPL